jgi:hypothetical protein
VLLSLSTVGSERVRERAGGRGGVDARRVVNGLWDMRLVSGLRDLELGNGKNHILGTERFPTKRMRGVRAVPLRMEVARIAFYVVM